MTGGGAAGFREVPYRNRPPSVPEATRGDPRTRDGPGPRQSPRGPAPSWLGRGSIPWSGSRASGFTRISRQASRSATRGRPVSTRIFDVPIRVGLLTEGNDHPTLRGYFAKLLSVKVAEIDPDVIDGTGHGWRFVVTNVDRALRSVYGDCDQLAVLSMDNDDNLDLRTSGVQEDSSHSRHWRHAGTDRPERCRCCSLSKAAEAVRPALNWIAAKARAKPNHPDWRSFPLRIGEARDRDVSRRSSPNAPSRRARSQEIRKVSRCCPGSRVPKGNLCQPPIVNVFWSVFSVLDRRSKVCRAPMKGWIGA